MPKRRVRNRGLLDYPLRKVLSQGFEGAGVPCNPFRSVIRLECGHGFTLDRVIPPRKRMRCDECQTAHTASGRKIRLWPTGIRVRDSRAPGITGRIAGHTFHGEHISSVPYVIAWDDEAAAEEHRGAGFNLGNNDNIEPCLRTVRRRPA